MTSLVVDASAVVELLLATAVGQRVATELANGQVLHAPQLLGVEVVSVLRRLTRLGEIDATEARQVLVELDALGVELYEHDTLLRRAFDLRESVTAYDAVYIALAEALDAPLLTCDTRLDASHGHDASVRLVR